MRSSVLIRVVCVGLSWASVVHSELSDTPVTLEFPKVDVDVTQDPLWTPPDYSGQDGALGYSDRPFEVPLAMKERVQFWMDVFTKLSSEQGVLHDSRYVHLVYGHVDFTDISQSSNLTAAQKEKRRRARVDQAKKTIADRILSLQQVTSREGLSGDDLRLFEMFEKVQEDDKFRQATQKGRLRFQLGQRDQFMSGIHQSGRYFRQIERIFREQGLPVELTRMIFVESSFNLKARSRVGASGIWQFMRSTARQYLKMDSAVDERNDPLRASVAAARKLRFNYEMLQSWPLAVTAYNHGPYGIRRLVQRHNTQDIVDLIELRQGSFGFASASFYASFLAALEVERRAHEFFGPLRTMPELVGDDIRISKPISRDEILAKFNGDRQVAQMYNPHILSSVWTGKQSLRPGHFLRIPIETPDLESRRATSN